MGGRVLTHSLKNLPRNRNAILTSALLTGLPWEQGARWAEPESSPLPSSGGYHRFGKYLLIGMGNRDSRSPPSYTAKGIDWPRPPW